MCPPIVRQEYRKGVNSTTKNSSSRGDNSNNFNVSETVYSNGNMSIVSDLTTKNIIQTNSSNIINGNNISDTQGSQSQWVNETAEISSNSSYKVVGNLANIRNGFFQEADKKQLKLVAMRSGFNDDRNETNLIPDLSLESIPSEILDNVSVIDKDVILVDDEPKIPSTGSIFENIGALVTNEINKIVNVVSKVDTKSELKKAELVAKNKIEKTKKILASIADLPEGPVKERFKNTIAEGDLSILFSSPSNEEKEKKDIYDREAYQAEAVDATNKLLAVERELT